jgi:hypothetical protein
MGPSLMITTARLDNMRLLCSMFLVVSAILNVILGQK